MGETTRALIDERVAHAYRNLAKQICAVAMTTWRRDYISLVKMGPPESDLEHPVVRMRALRHIRADLASSIGEIEEFFQSDWYRDVLCGMAPEMVLCPFSEYKEKTYEEISKNGIYSITEEE